MQIQKIADDNSCLFSAVSFVFDKVPVQKLRQVVSRQILDGRFTPIELERSIQDYASRILQKDTWGGAIELVVLSDFYKTEIASIDVESLRMDVFGQGKYENRVYLL